MTSRRAVALLLAPLALAACGGASATPTPVPAAQPTMASTLQPLPTATAGTSFEALQPSVPATPVASATPIAFHVDPILEQQLPVLVEGQKVTVETLPVSSYLQLMDPTSDAAHSLRRFLSEVGSDPAAITVAFASYGAGQDLVEFQAYRAPRARPDHLLAATVYLMRSATGDPASATVATTRLGNRTVTTIMGSGPDPVVLRVFVEGEIAVVSAAPEASVRALLDALP
jgi:hypothetical protein